LNIYGVDMGFIAKKHFSNMKIGTINGLVFPIHDKIIVHKRPYLELY